MRGASPALVLNADFRPLSYFPLSVWSWQDAVKAVFLDRVNIVSEYDDEVHSPSFSMRLPSVIALKQYVPLSRKPVCRCDPRALRLHLMPSPCILSGCALPPLQSVCMITQVTPVHVVLSAEGARAGAE